MPEFLRRPWRYYAKPMSGLSIGTIYPAPSFKSSAAEPALTWDFATREYSVLDQMEKA